MATELNATVQASIPGTYTSPDSRSCLILNTYIDNVRVIGFAEPTAWSDHGIELAGIALQVAHQFLANNPVYADLSPRQRLERATQAANDVVRARNKEACGHDHESNIGVGLGLVLRTGKTATIALSPPMQVMILQGGSATWLPRLESWTGDDPGVTGKPLGWSNQVNPTFMTTTVEHGDEILLTTSTVAEALAHRKPAGNSTAALCDQIALFAEASASEPVDIVALATRFEAESLTGNLRAATRQLFGDVDRRARAVWSALRTPAQLLASKTPESD